MKLVDGKPTTKYSALNWSMVKPIFDKYTICHEFPRRQVPVETMRELHACLNTFTEALGGTFGSNGSRNLFYIAPILIHVTRQVERVEILVEENINGKRVHANGRFEFVICCGAKRVCIVEAKKTDSVYGIATNYTEWIFIKRENEQILREYSSLTLNNREVPTLESLQTIAEIFHAMLVDNQQRKPS
ncbi:Crinkler (CRN) family protein [Thraustotheca clavata]|uniref:Crinkler (CRN) family protein n=1 Tax=Thraustotheca clavata TaxID=74557 RepID=A0A1W0A9D2_9STRA|nr:Crinkler (CRN) family protein [Thraustotheca clavata]